MGKCRHVMMLAIAALALGSASAVAQSAGLSATPAPIIGTWTWEGTRDLCPVTLNLTRVNPDQSVDGTVQFRGNCGFRRTLGANQTPPIRTSWDGKRFVLLYMTDGTRIILDYNGRDLVGKEVLVKGNYRNFTFPPRPDGTLNGTLDGHEVPGEARFVRGS